MNHWHVTHICQSCCKEQFSGIQTTEPAYIISKMYWCKTCGKYTTYRPIMSRPIFNLVPGPCHIMTDPTP